MKTASKTLINHCRIVGRRTSCIASSMSGSAAGKDLSGKIILITGSTDGIGLHTATKLAKQNATVLLHGRNPTRLAAAEKQLKSVNPTCHTDTFCFDLASISDTNKFADDVLRKHEKLDVLVNNAGVYEEQRRITGDGFEMTWQVNVLAPYIITSKLLPITQQRVVNVASISAASRLDTAASLNADTTYSAHATYSLSKLCNIIFTKALARKLGGSGPTVNCLDPGTVNTKMLLAGWGPIGIEVSDANNIHYLVTSDDVADSSGKYYVSRRETSPPGPGSDVAVQEEMWGLWGEQTGAQYQL